MKINPDQLKSKLKQSLLPIYIVSGDEHLLVQEACDEIRSAAKAAGYSERHVFQHEPNHFNWQAVLDVAQAMSLFGDRQLIDLRINKGTLDDVGRKAIEAYLEHINPDTLLLISMPKLEASTQKTRWYKQAEELGASVVCWPLKLQDIPAWLNQRLQRVGLSADPEALALIAERVEGNLLAAQQEVDKLALLVDGDNKHISLETAFDVVANSSRYTVFNLMDRCLAGKSAEALKVFRGLIAEGATPFELLWAISRDIRRLIHVQEKRDQGQQIDRLLMNQGVRGPQQNLFKIALKRKDIRQLYHLLDSCQKIDIASKGGDNIDPLVLMERLVLNLSH